MASTNETIAQLNAARGLALSDAAYYSQIVPGVLPIIGTSAPLELRRWGADFLAETFASPTLGSEEKQQLSLKVLPLLKDYLEIPGEDMGVTKSVVQAAASIYPLVFRHIVNNENDAPTWQTMAAIKSNILRRMDTAPPGVRICCIKFVQRVVQTQTPGLIADPRRPEQNEISLALVKRDHPLTPPSILEAEASGLLDRLLGILQDNSSDALLVTATLNSAGSLIRSRPAIANKIISAVLTFNPLKLAISSPMAPKTRVMVKSMERTTRAFLLHVMKRNSNNPLNPRIQQYLERLLQSRTEIFDETNRKRPAPVEPTESLDPAKRQRLGADVGAAPSHRPAIPLSLPPGPVSVAQLFTLTEDQGAKNFDVQAIPMEIVATILVPMIHSINKEKMDNAINAVRSRYLSLSAQQPRTALEVATAATSKPPAADENEEYEPAEDAEQILNKLSNAPPDDLPPQPQPPVALGPFRLPQPPPLSDTETDEYSKSTVNRVLGVMSALDESSGTKTSKAGLNRLAASSYDRNAWVTVIARIATRASAGVDEKAIKTEDSPNKSLSRHRNFAISNAIREALNLYVVEDFRRRIDVAISWLNEEWYNDRIQSQQQTDGETVLHYDKWMLRLLDQMVPYLDAKDKVLIRFLSEIPALGAEVLERVKKLARDPERVQLAVNAIHYLILLRPPVREICIDTLEDLWRNYDDAKTPAAKLLAKWRPQVLQQRSMNGSAESVKVE